MAQLGLCLVRTNPKLGRVSLELYTTAHKTAEMEFTWRALVESFGGELSVVAEAFGFGRFHLVTCL